MTTDQQELPWVEYRAQIPGRIDRQVSLLLPTLAESRGVRRVTKTEVLTEALQLWLRYHEADGLQGPPVTGQGGLKP